MRVVGERIEANVTSPVGCTPACDIRHARHAITNPLYPSVTLTYKSFLLCDTL